MVQCIHSKEKVEFGVCWDIGEIDAGVRVNMCWGVLVVIGWVCCGWCRPRMVGCVFLVRWVTVAAVPEFAGAGLRCSRVAVRAVGVRCLVVVHGSSGVPGELSLMPEIDSLGVVEANITSPHESIGWAQSCPNIGGGVCSP